MQSITSLINNQSPSEVYQLIQSLPELESLKNVVDFNRVFLRTADSGYAEKVIPVIYYFLEYPDIFTNKPSEYKDILEDTLACCYLQLNQYEECLSVTDNILTRKHNDFYMANALYHQAMVYFDQGNYGMTYEKYFKASKLAENKSEIKFEELKADIHVNLFTLYCFIGNTATAEYHIERAKSIYDKYEKNASYPIFLLNLSSFKYDSGKLTIEEAQQVIEQALEMALQFDNEYQIGTCKLSKAQIIIRKIKEKPILNVVDKADLAEAEKLITDLFAHKEKFPFPTQGMIVKEYVDILLLKKEKTRFLQNLEDCMNILQAPENEQIYIEVLTEAVQILTDKKDYQTAVKYFYLLDKARADLLKNNKKSALQISSVRLDLQAKEQEINRLEELSRSERKLTEELSRKNKELEAFALIAAHDLKAPLRNISAFTGLLKRKLQLQPDEADMFDFIVTATKDMSKLVDDLLVFAKSGSYKSKAVRHALNDVITVVQTKLNRQIAESQAQIIIKNALPDLEVHFNAMVQLFQNLIGNSIKFARTNAPPVIEIHTQLKNEKLHILLTDNGKGISEENIEHIFKPLFRIHETAHIEGTGLGLATCQKIAEFYQGNISVKSTIGKGSTFTITLPLGVVVEEPAVLV